MSPPPSPSGEVGRGRSAATSRVALILLLAGLALLRLAAAAAIPLTEDEAYYRLWAQHLRLGYYDHPPLAAWGIAAGVHLVGDNALGVRLASVLASLCATGLVWDLGRRLGGPRTDSESTGLTAAVLYNATLTVGFGSILALPDCAASLFWMLTLWALARAIQGSPRWWLAAGAAAGLACLSKYSALFLAPGVVLWLALTDEGRRRLRTPWPWLAATIALALFAANVAWNAEHHWLTFAKQFGRVSPGRFAPRYLTEFIAAQFALANPAVAVLAAIGAAKAWRGRTTIPMLAAATSAPFLAYLLLHSLHDRVQAHWPVPLYGAAALLAAFAAQGAWGWKAGLARWAPVGIALTALALGYMALPTGLIRKGDPASQLRGWPAFTGQVERLRLQSGAAWVGTLSYGVNGQLQARHGIAAPILQIDERDRYADLPAAAPDLTRPGLIVDLMRRVQPGRLRACFKQVGPLRQIDRVSGADADSRYGAVVVMGPKGDLAGRGCA